MNLTTYRKKNRTPSNKHLLSKTIQYIEAKDWYTKGLDAIKSKYGIHTEVFIDLLAVTSPRTSVKINLRNAETTLKYFILDKKIDFSYGLANKAIKNNVDKIRVKKKYGGQKVNKFAKALKGDLSQVVIDSWMLKVFNVNRQYPLPNDIKHIETIIKNIADKANLKPAEVQACLWSYAKTELNNSTFKEDNDFSFYIKGGIHE